MLEKIKKIKTWQVAILFAIVGLATYMTGLNSPFQNDDFPQIVNNTPVHSITNLPTFFTSSTFFNGEKMTGVYYRPLMTTTFIYTIFKANPIPYHLVQLAFFIAGAFILFLVFKHFFKKIPSLILSLIFLVHPLNSQIVFSIPTMQDVLFFFFGILALWLIINKKLDKRPWIVALCLTLSIFSKESGFLFVAISFLYLFWFDRKKIITLVKYMAIPLILYVLLRTSAVGFAGASRAVPINDLSFTGRLFTAPSVMLFYLAKFIYPHQLSLGYYWTNPVFSIDKVLIPLLVDLLVVGLFIYLGRRVYKKLPRDKFKYYLFFAIWTLMGLGLYMQIIPGLDFTACETWFYFAMAGLLGMIGVSLLTIKTRFNPKWLLIPALVLIVALGVRTGLRGIDYKSQYNLAVVDLSVSSDNYPAMSNISQYLIDNNRYKEAIVYAQRSISIYPILSNSINLGVALQYEGEYEKAKDAYNQALKYGNISIVYENLCLIYIATSTDYYKTEQLIQAALKEYPRNYKIWLYEAVFEGASGMTSEAKTAITNAVKYGPIPQVIYDNIMQDKPFTVPILDKTLLVK